MPSQSINRLWRSLLDLDRGLKQTLCLLSQEAEVPASAVALVFKLEHEDSLKVNDVAPYLALRSARLPILSINWRRSSGSNAYVQRRIGVSCTCG